MYHPVRCGFNAPAALLLLLALGCARHDWSPTARPLDQEPPMLHADLRLELDSPVDADLQQQIEQADARLCAELEIAPEQRAFGVYDLSDNRLALLRPDEMFYGASVPKICIALAYFERFPQAVSDLDPGTLRELQLMIKRSSNELAAKYSQLVGLDFIQDMQTGDRYAFYEPTHGGLWCGKHYGAAEPRRGDPIKDLSHAVTVRQCLRYYLMMETGQPCGNQVADRLRQVFAAPQLEFHDDNFVRGLRGRDVQILRKNGLWEDWHLDTARVRHGRRVYLLAGATRHPRGGEYLAGMAAAIDDALCGPARPLEPIHHLDVREPAAQLLTGGPKGGEIFAMTIEPPEKFNEAVLSWNVECPEAAGFIVEVRVGRRHDNWFSPWLHIGDWNVSPQADQRVTSFDGGRIDIDYFRSEQRYDRLEYRVRALSREPTMEPVRVQRFAVCTSDLTGLPRAVPRVRPATGKTSGEWQRRLPVPFRSQKTEDAEIAGRICSPTSVAMVLEYRGTTAETSRVAQSCLDPFHDLYGVWPRNVQSAFALGVPSYLARFSAWEPVEQLIAAGQPLIISIRVPNEGDLRNAPYKTTAGHLLVLTGFDADGLVHVNDPAASTAETGVLRYHRTDLEKVWMQATGGLAYVLLESP